MKKINKAEILLCILAGLLYCLGFPSIFGETLFITPILGHALLFFLTKNKSLKIQLLYVLFFSVGFNVFGFYWITKTLVEFGQLPFILAQLLSLLFSLIILPQHWVYFLAQKYLPVKKIKGLQLLIILAALFTTVEYFTPQQFPAHVGHSWFLFAKYLGIATIFGAPFFSFLNIFIAQSLAEAYESKKIRSYYYLVPILLIALIPLDSSKIEGPSKNLNLRVVQANVGNFMKVNAEKGGVSSISEIFKRYSNLSVSPYPFNQGKPDLIIWPETAYPYSMTSEKIKDQAKFMPSLFSNIIKKMDTTLLTGGYDRKLNSKAYDYFETEYNAVFKFKGTGLSQVYHKKKLIPFGETLPFPDFINDFLNKQIASISFFASGEQYTRFVIRGSQSKELSFISPICYEILYSSFIREYLENLKDKQPDFIVNLTNDSWYGDTAEPYQHLFLAKWRAIEFKLPIVRSTNTGITSVIFPDGSESKRLLHGELKNLDLEVELKQYSTTLFQKYGFKLNFILWIFLFLIGRIKRFC
ncbi:MAG: apolipoprotein N-acyltransferase [Thermoproteota archaeon]|jgi:apolipoprotein N-acyltransferase